MGALNEAFCRNTCLVLVTLFLGIVVISCASPGISEYRMIPTRGKTATTSAYEEKVLFSSRYLDAEERMIYLRDKGHESLGVGLRQISFLTFVLEVQNLTDRELILDPGSIRLAVGIGPLLSPYNYAHLYLELPRGSDRQRILEDLRMAIYDKSTSIHAGESMEKLLLFKRPEEVGPAAAILLNRLYLGGEESEAVLDFTTVDLEE